MDAHGGTAGAIDTLVHNGVNTNQYENPGGDIYILRLAFYQKLFDDKLTLRIGKFDISDFMDYNRFGYYNFLAYSFAHNTAIPLPGNTLGAMFTLHPNDWLTLQGGFNNSDQTPPTLGFNTFGNGDFLQLYEASAKTHFFGQDGSYRFLGWYDSADRKASTARASKGPGSVSGSASTRTSPRNSASSPATAARTSMSSTSWRSSTGPPASSGPAHWSLARSTR